MKLIESLQWLPLHQVNQKIINDRYVTEKTLSLQKSIKHKRLGFKDLWIYVHQQGKFKVLSTKVYTVTSFSCGCKSLEYTLKAYRYLSCLPRKLSFHVLFYDFQVFVSDMLWPRKLETIWPFLECIVAKNFDKVNVCGQHFKFAMLVTFYP